MDKKLVRENMSTDLITIGWMERVEVAFKRMQAGRVRHLPVLDDSGTVVGVLSDRDVQRAMVSTIDRSSGRALADETIEFNPESRVRDYMSWPAKTVDQRTDLRLVAETMVKEKISCLLVCSGTRTLGIVTAEDLLKVLIEFLSDPKTPARWSLDDVMEGAFGKLSSTLV